LSSPLKNFRILIADADQRLANVLKTMLTEMGFSHPEITSSATHARELLKEKHFDFLITEWKLRDTDGISFIKQIRNSADSPNPLLPIVMLTGHAEHTDVETARDSGVNEYVVKPFSAKTIFNRLERIIENPRQFIAAPNFVGPDRRHKGTPPPGVADRRTLNITPEPHPPKDLAASLKGALPKIWTPDFSLKKKLGHEQPLSSVITSSVLEIAQASINAITNESLQWIKIDLMTLKALYERLIAQDGVATLPHALSEIALTINSHAGTFGYTRAGQVAYKLYAFCRNDLKSDNPRHHTIVQKHIEVLQVIFGINMQGMGGKAGEQIAMELQNLVFKYTT
jgi:CheY-like chemotaxis protein